jgi:hypothetical protein
VWEIGWIGQKRIKTREQTYMELMVEMMEESTARTPLIKLTLWKSINVRTYTYAQPGTGKIRDAPCLKIKIQCLGGAFVSHAAVQR